MSQSYKTGTVTVTAGQTSVVGSGTAWALALATGGLFCCQGASIPCTVVDDTHLELDVAWPATSGAGKTYSIFRETAQAASAVLANDRLAEVADRLNKLSYINFDAMGILAQRAAYDAAPKDFIFLDIGVDPFQIYIKASDAVGDWKGPNPYGRGPRGLQGDTGLKGDPGPAYNPRGAYSGATAYAKYDVVLYQGSSYFATQATTGNLPTNATYWQLLAQKGTDGTGTGDTTGPSTSALNQLVAFGDTSGKLLRALDTGMEIPSFDFNLALSSGFYVGPSQANALNAPPNNATLGGLLVIRRSSTIAVQLAISPAGIMATRGTSNAGATWTDWNASGIAPSMITDTHLVNVPTGTIKGRVAAGSGDLANLTAAQVKTLLALAKADVGLGNVDNTSDALKPVSTAQQTALNGKLNTSGGTMTGAMVLSGAPTNDLHAATKKYVDDQGGGTWTSSVALTGTAIDLTGIPAGAQQVIAVVTGATGGGGNVLVQLGTSGGVDASSTYSSTRAQLTTTAATVTATTGFDIAQMSASAPLRVIIHLYLADSATNTWALSWIAGNNAATAVLYPGSGSKSLSGVLDRIRFLKTANDYTAGSVRLFIK